MKQLVESTKMLIIALIFECSGQCWHPHLFRLDLFVVSARAASVRREPLTLASGLQWCRRLCLKDAGLGLSHSGYESGSKGELAGLRA